MTDERRAVRRRKEDDTCPHDCSVCYRYNLQMKWLLSCAAGVGAGLVILTTMVVTNKTDIGKLSTDQSVVKMQAQYTIESLNEIKLAMGLAVRMPPKLEALKEE